MEETPCDLTKPRIAPYKNTWKRFQNTVFWCNLKLAQERVLQFYQTRSRAVVLCNTLPAACIEKAVCMKTQDEFCQKVRLTPRVPRVVLKPNSQNGLQDPQNQDARPSWEPSSDSKSRGHLHTLSSGSRPTCKQLRRHRQPWTKPSRRRATGIFCILQALTTAEFFSKLGQVSVAWRKKLQPTDGRCEQYTNKYSTYRVAQQNHNSSRVAQDQGMHIFVSLKTLVIHVSCLVRFRT